MVNIYSIHTTYLITTGNIVIIIKIKESNVTDKKELLDLFSGSV